MILFEGAQHVCRRRASRKRDHLQRIRLVWTGCLRAQLCQRLWLCAGYQYQQPHPLKADSSQMPGGNGSRQSS